MFQMKNLRIKGIYSHLCASDGNKDEEVAYTLKQIEVFEKTLTQLKSQGIQLPNTHLLASYGVINYPNYSGDYARVGIALYWLLSTKEDGGNYRLPLKPVLSIKSRVVSIRKLAKDEAAGYGLAYIALEEKTIAAISIGYADGVPRDLSGGKGSVLIRGQVAPIIGRVCMDQMIVDISNIRLVKRGDEVVIVGKSGNLEITVCDIAEQVGTISNEIISRLGARLERRVIKA